MKLVLEFDDLNCHPEVDCLGVIKKLVNLYPKIKLTFFTPAAYKNYPLTSNQKWCDEIRNLIESNNVNLAVHGLYHTQEEFKFIDCSEANSRLEIVENIFNEAKLPFNKIFRSPHWGIQESTYEALINRNYSSVWTHEDYKWLADKFPEIKSIYYNWNLKDKFEDSGAVNEDIVIAHGHSHSVCGNGIGESFDRICDMIDKYNPEFIFASEV